MIQNVLREIGGVGLYGVISICLFVVVFCGAIVKVLCMSRSTVETLGALPLSDDSVAAEKKGESHHE